MRNRTSIHYVAGLLSLGFLSLALGCDTQSKTSNERHDTPRTKAIRFLDGAGHDFGNVRAHESLSWSCEFRNVSREEVALTLAAKSCLCTSATLSRKSLPPGEMASVLLDTEAKETGKRDLYVQIEAKGIVSGQVELFIVDMTYTLIDVVLAVPRTVTLGRVTPGSTVEREGYYSFRVAKGRPKTDFGVTFEQPAKAVGFQTEAVTGPWDHPSYEEWRVPFHIAYTAPSDIDGHISHTIMARARIGAKEQIVRVSVAGEGRNGLYLSPSVAVFALDRNSENHETVRVEVISDTEATQFSRLAFASSPESSEMILGAVCAAIVREIPQGRGVGMLELTLCGEMTEPKQKHDVLIDVFLKNGDVRRVSLPVIVYSPFAEADVPSPPS